VIILFCFILEGNKLWERAVWSFGPAPNGERDMYRTAIVLLSYIWLFKAVICAMTSSGAIVRLQFPRKAEWHRENITTASFESDTFYCCRYTKLLGPTPWPTAEHTVRQKGRKGASCQRRLSDQCNEGRRELHSWYKWMEPYVSVGNRISHVTSSKHLLSHCVLHSTPLQTRDGNMRSLVGLRVPAMYNRPMWPQYWALYEPRGPAKGPNGG
jgi:hypothetical protein